MIGYDKIFLDCEEIEEYFFRLCKSVLENVYLFCANDEPNEWGPKAELDKGQFLRCCTVFHFKWRQVYSSLKAEMKYFILLTV